MIGFISVSELLYDERPFRELFRCDFNTIKIIDLGVNANAILRKIGNEYFYKETEYSWIYCENENKLSIIKHYNKISNHCFVVTPTIQDFLNLLNYDLSIYGGYVCFHGYIDHLIGKRFIAKEEHDYELSDYLRDEIKSFGMNIKDTKQGSSYWFNTNGTINITKKPIEYPENVKVWSSFSMFINNTIMNR